MQKVLETFFRHKLLLLLPPVLITAIVAPLSILTAPMYYESWTGIWVDKPTYLSYSNDWNQWLTPAQNQAGALTEMLRTQSFLTDVAKRTSLAALTNTQRGLDRAQATITDGLTVYPTGTHLVVLRFRATTPQLAYQVLNGVVESFRDTVTNQRTNQAALATSFYQAQLETAQSDLDKAGDDLRRYLAANPRVGDASRGFSVADPNTGVITDPQLAQLQQTYSQKQQDLQRLNSSLQAAQFDASASLQAQDLGFQVIDPAQVPTSGGRDLKKRMLYPAAALVAGLGLSAVLLVLLAASDRSVRSERELGAGVRVLGEVPKLALKRRRLPKHLKTDATRRAIGFVAGAALPAPGGAK
jgi:uncharacterized protein involved in exopolysaccharide biosynthesis